ncbi:MAG: type II toxin-antitoxin system HicA family toxin [Gemmatimonadaceae bacterium]
MKSREIMKRLEAEGWRLLRVNGSHHMMGHPTNPDVIVVKHPQKDCPLGTLKKIERQSGVKLR